MGDTIRQAIHLYDKSEMKTKNIVLTSAIFTIVLFASYFTYSTYAVRHVAIKNFTAESIQFTQTGFVAGGRLIVENPSLISVDIKSINYTVKLERTNQTLGTGLVLGKKIRAKSTADFVFNHEISWQPTAELAYQLITANETFIVITGTVKVSENPEINLPFEKKVDIKPYVLQFAESQIKKAADVWENIIPGSGSLVNSIAEGISDWLN